ncbi:MAG: site-specific integrase [Planctomycetes bacterium]|nr:site-specific integrase [Planctomycetota bacterium]
MSWTKVGLYHYANRKLPWMVRWYGEINPKTGQPKRYSKSFRTKRKADDFKAEKMQEFKKGIKRDRPEKVTLGRLCEEFLKTWNPAAKESTKGLYRNTIARLFNYFAKSQLVRSVGPREADSFLASQIHYLIEPNKQLSEWSRLQIVTHCKTIFDTAVRWQWITKNPFADVRMIKPCTKRWHRLTVPEYRRLVDVAPTLRWKLFYAMAYTSGARSGELFSLTWADIDFERGRLNIQNREGTDRMPSFSIKDKDARFVQLPTETLDLLAQYQQEAPEGVPYILLTAERYKRVLQRWHKYRKQGKPWKNRYMVNNVLRDFKVHAKRAGLQFNGEFTIHTFRKTCAQNWADYLPTNVVKFYLGHSNINTTNKFYSIVDESHTARTTKVMNQMLKAETENHLDTPWTLRVDSKQKLNTKEEVAKTNSSVNPSHQSISDASDKWAVLDLNQ